MTDQAALDLQSLRLPIDPFDRIPNGGTYWCIIGLVHPGEQCSHGQQFSCKSEARFKIGRYTKSKLGNLETRWFWDECETHAKARARKHDLTLPDPGEKWERWPAGTRFGNPEGAP